MARKEGGQKFQKLNDSHLGNISSIHNKCNYYYEDINGSIHEINLISTAMLKY
jgi:hypothetical protein